MSDDWTKYLGGALSGLAGGFGAGMNMGKRFNAQQPNPVNSALDTARWDAFTQQNPNYQGWITPNDQGALSEQMKSYMQNPGFVQDVGTWAGQYGINPAQMLSVQQPQHNNLMSLLFGRRFG